MKKWKLTFRNFKWLDRRTTQMWTSPVAKPTDIGFEEMYGLIKEWVLHPLPAYASVQSWSWKLFEVGWDLYFMNTSGVKKRNWVTFANFIVQAFNNSPEYRDIKPFFDLTAVGAVTVNYVSATDQSITVSTTMPINKYVNKHVAIGSLPNPGNQFLYITGNDEHTIYTDGLINGDMLTWSPTVNIFNKIPTLVVYDGNQVHRFNKATGTNMGTVDTFTDWFIEVFANRLFLLKQNQIIFSTFNCSIFTNTPFNYIDVDGTIVDKMITSNAIIVFTTQGTYGLNGTGFTTMNFPKISEFSPHTRVYPLSWTDNLYVNRDWYVRQFSISDGLLQTQYNYAVIPDTHGNIFTIERWIIFPLGHGTTKYGILNVEELQNRKVISISNFYDNTIDDLIEYKGQIFLISWGTIYKQSWTSAPRFKMNTFRMPNKTFRDIIETAQWGNYPASIDVTLDWVTTTILRNDWANQVSYPVRNTWYAISMAMTATDPIASFNIYYMV